ncbi:MAG: histidine kinase dimerization/phospho-acceptor domain-containing protein, partial [Burkholderiaceae bacterium]
MWLSLAILGVALVAGAFSFLAAFQEAQELQDDVLRQMAVLFDVDAAGVPARFQAALLADRDGDSRVFVQRLARDADGAGNGGDGFAVPATLADGLQTVNAGRESFRVLVKTLDSGERIALAQQTEVRNEIARDSALRTLMPFLILVPILLGITAGLVRTMFRPIAALSAEVDSRGEGELHPLDAAALPSEVEPFVAAINRLLVRVAQSMAAQRRFVADAAHELRSPLTALSLQAERLADAEMSDAARTRFAALRQGIERGRSLLDQMLTLARVQSRSAETPPGSEDSETSEAVSVHRVYRRVLEDLMPLAESKGMNIGMAEEPDR